MTRVKETINQTMMNNIKEEYESDDYMKDDKLNVKVFIKEAPLITRNSIKEEASDFINGNVTESIVAISGIKEEPIDTFDFIDVKCGPSTSDQTFYCELSEEVCLGLCSNCPIPMCILNNNVQSGSEDGAWNTLPKNILTIKNSPTDAEGIFTLVSIPEDIIFGPCGGLEQAQQDEGYIWRLKSAKFVNVEGVERFNWMQLVNCAKVAADRNLNIFQYEGRLYYKSSRQINKGEELLVYYVDELAQNADIETDYYPLLEKHLGDVYGCTFCSLGFDSKMHLLQHRTKCTPAVTITSRFKELIQCPFCKIYLEEGEYLEFHMNFCSENYSRKCTIDAGQNCDYGSNGHLRTDTGEKPFECEACKKCFKRKTDLRVHMRIHSGEKPYECEICKKCFTRKSHLADHGRIHSEEKLFECNVCKKCFVRRSDLRRHVGSHDGEKSFECEICNKIFAMRANHKAHLLTHTGERPHACEICEKRFKRMPDLRVHMRIHSGEKPFTCEVCGKCFTRSSHLADHARIHSGEKPFECEICKKCFTDNSSLRLHVLNHIGDKPFQCEICKKCFIRRSDMRRHVGRHSGKKPFECEICNKTFVVRANVKTHLLTHTGEKPHECEICKKCFARKSNLTKHIRIHGGEKRLQ